ncbi:hypothetical protein [Paraflavitalea speifideaquila]|uniref:hypothetical protein n=1 Tax=Paraflavitalea speifideaquila TaxID=3076558 RepID=UPI0028ECD405|nr:hypothetical protein [Paraflavitalea speifideiaquila]
MKTVFDKATRDELIARIEQVNENSERQWGKMTVYQMLKHCSIWEAWILKSQPNKVSFLESSLAKVP